MSKQPIGQHFVTQSKPTFPWDGLAISVLIIGLVTLLMYFFLLSSINKNYYVGKNSEYISVHVLSDSTILIEQKQWWETTPKREIWTGRKTDHLGFSFKGDVFQIQMYPNSKTLSITYVDGLIDVYKRYGF